MAIGSWVAAVDHPVGRTAGMTSEDFTAPHFDRSVLLVIDVQTDFLDGGASPIEGTSARLPRMVELVEGFRAAGRPIVHVVRVYEGDDIDLVR
jgi:hypothetical protein